MNGGEISENTTGTNGGIYSFSNNVKLNAGNISKNHASMGDGVYVEGNDSRHSTLHMKNVVIAENKSGDQGGGLWFCSIGDGKIYVTNGGVIYGNTADGAGNDIAFTKSKKDSSLILAKWILGGGSVLYYRDGRIFAPSTGLILGSTDKSALRYTSDASAKPVDVVEEKQSLALAATIDSAAIPLAVNNVKLFITENIAPEYGGVIIGEQDDWTLNVTKDWKELTDDSLKQPVTVYLKIGDTVLDPIELNADNNWTGSFEQLPGVDTLSGNVSYAAMENPVSEHFTRTYSDAVVDEDSRTISINITNTYAPIGNLTVSKTVSGNGASNTKAFTFTVTLDNTTISGTYGDMTFENGVAAFTLKADERKTTSNLPASVGYTV